MGKVHHKIQDDIITLYKSGLCATNIKKKLCFDGSVVSRGTIHYTIRNYKSGHLEAVRGAKETKQMRKISEMDITNIKDLLNLTKTMTSKDVQYQLNNNGASLSRTSVKRAIKMAGFINSQPRYAQMVRDANKVKRVDFCKELISKNDSFDDVIFTDESTVQLHQNRKVVYRPTGTSRTYFPKPKHPLKVHVWAGISRKGPTKITIFDGVMESTFFTQKILGDNLVPFIEKKFPQGHRFQQDNDPKHKSKLTKEFMQNHNINWTPWPAESPDINPIEMVWNQLKRFVARKEPQTKKQLEECIKEFWSSYMTKEQCNLYIDHLYKVVPVCVKVGGAATGDLPNKFFPESSRGKSIDYFVRKLDMVSEKS